MSPWIRAAVLVVLALAGVWVASPAIACSCGFTTPLRGRLAQAEVVFLGTVIVSPRGEPPIAVFRVDERFKGPEVSQIEISSPHEGTSCRLGFPVGERYLVYGQRTPTTGLSADRCNGTSHVSRAWPDLHYLRAEDKEALVHSLCPPGKDAYARPALEPDGLPGFYCWNPDESMFYPDGPGMVWHHEGWKRAQGIYHRGVMHGPWTFYNEDGSVSSQMTCDNADCRPKQQ